MATGNSSGSSPPSPRAAPAGTTPVLLRATTPSLGQVSVDALGPGRLIVKADGSISWDVSKSDDASNRPGFVNGLASLAKSGLEVALTVSGCVALYATASAIDHSLRNGYCLTSGQLTRMVASAVSSCMAGTATGWVYGPVLAARHLLGRMFRPFLLACSLYQVARGGLGMLRNRLPKASDIIYILQNGTTEQQLAAATQLQQHAGSGRFARRFARLGGTTLLASALAPAAATPVDPAVASMLLQALAKLCKTEGARRAFVEAGGMPAVLAVLPPTPAEPSTPPRGGDQDGSFVIVGEGTPAAPATPAADAEAAVVPAAGGRPGADIVAVIEVLRLLLGDAECKEVAVEAGAPGRLAGLLRGSNMALLRAVLGALGSSLDHPLAREAVRASGGVSRLLSLLSSIAHAAVRTLVLRLLAALSLEPVVLQELQQRHAVPLLVQLLRQQTMAAKEEPRRACAMLVARSRRPGGPEDVSGAVLELLELLLANGPAAQELREQPLAREVLGAVEVAQCGAYRRQDAALASLKYAVRPY